MLKKRETFIIHPVFGKIRIEEKFAKVLQLPCFRELAFKSQLGSISLSKVTINSKHSRLTHSIGVMYLTEKLIESCDQKFSDFFSITPKEKDVLKLAALGHDIGHIAFSHSLEDKNMKSHEERTIEYFEKYAEDINEIFGWDIVSDVIQIYRDNIDIKKHGNQVDVQEDIDLLFVFKSLLVGTIDCDRMEYLTLDRLNVYGELVNFSDIFKYITIVLLNNSPTVGFEKEAVPIIENMLFTRFDQYSSLYYEDDSVLMELILKRYKEIEGWDEERTTQISEYEILSELKSILLKPKEINTERHRIAEIILEGNRENIMFRRFDNKQEYEYFLKRLQSIIKEKDIIRLAKKKVTVYDPDKNRVYIKDDDGLIKDITEVSPKIRNFTVYYKYIMVDLDPIYGLEPEQIRDIKSLFLDNPVEIEKKFTFKENETKTYSDCCKEISRILKEIPGVSIKEFSEWDNLINEDTYFESKQVPEGVAIRHRKSGSKESYYVKIPADDGTSITKRHENKYNCKNVDEFLKLATELFRTRGYDIEEIQVTEGVKIDTHRYKTLAKVRKSMIEIACDFSTYEYAGKKSNGMMLECELKEGDDISLWYLGKHLKRNGFIETNESKETRAKKALNIL